MEYQKSQPDLLKYGNDHTFIKEAYKVGNESYCERRKVGCVIVKDNQIIANGRNGTFPGEPNECEDCNGLTKWQVRHAEFNAIIKATKACISLEGSTLYVTLSPCKDCAKLILAYGITRVVFSELYKDDAGIKELLKMKVEVSQIDYNEIN